MRTSLNKIRTIEEFLNGSMPVDERLLFEAQQVVDRSLAEEVLAQQQTYQLVTAYSRAALRQELESFHHTLMNDPAKKGFRDLIRSIFQKH
jgi:hypothetical protein